MSNLEEIRNNHFPTFKKYYFTSKNWWLGLTPATKSLFKLLPIFLILAAIPLTVNLSQKEQNLKSSAATDIPVSRPFIAPVTTQTFNVPNNIDSTGATDASSALNTFLGTVPDGSVINFPSNGIFLMNHGLLISGRHNLVFTGNGAQFKANGSGTNEADSPFLVKNGSSHIAINNFIILGNNPNTTTLFGGGELMSAVSLSGWYGGPPSSYVEVGNCTVSHMFTDGVYLEGQNVSPNSPSSFIWIHDNAFSYLGRNGVSSINVTNVLIENNSFDKVAMDVWDVEPNLASETVVYNTFKNNTVGSYGHMTSLIGWFFSAWTPAATATVHDIVVSSNNVTGILHEGYDNAPRRLNSRFTITRTSNITFTNNITTQAATGPILVFEHIDGLTFTDNIQPLTSGSLASITDSTNVTNSGNLTTNPTPTSTSNITSTPTSSPKPTNIQTPTPTIKPTTTPILTPKPTTTTPVAFYIASGPTTGNITNMGAIITWYLSDYGTGQVQYGTTSQYGLLSVPETSFNWNYHIQTLTNLTPGITYHYRVKSTNQAGTTIYSSDSTFTTTGAATPTLTPTPAVTTPTIKLTPTPTIKPTPTPIVRKYCYRFIYWKFCY